MKKTILLSIFTLITLFTFSCTQEYETSQGFTSELENVETRNDNFSQLDAALDELIEYMNILDDESNGELYQSIENGANLDDLIDQGYLNIEDIQPSLDNIEALNNEIIETEGMEALNAWYSNKSGNVNKNKGFCIICKKVYWGPCNFNVKLEWTEWSLFGVINVSTKNTGSAPC